MKTAYSSYAALDVLHDFFVPAFRVHVDVLPDRIGQRCQQVDQ